MSEQAPHPPAPTAEHPNTNSNSINGIPAAAELTDISMTDAPTDHLAPPRSTSRAPSAHPDPSTTASTGPGTTTATTTAGFSMPPEAAAHGAPVRQYINRNITGTLLEGMKIVAREQPKDPLRVLGEFLLQRSRELEGRDSAS
ncbi:hypothetical protein BT67DRAFT_387194 [Trichocladium antarcticum]|uniref:Dpy-30 domain-containing protein n=1 Tax=Trichocladium antarcticum TaxID=1450529 RepID=A0AAN6UET2_9PEZI|nr:hypothetical protein BT67DRAFT_387194 [Trichocladium antarcticum]